MQLSDIELLMWFISNKSYMGQFAELAKWTVDEGQAR